MLELYRAHIGSGAAKLATLMGLPVEGRSEGPYVWDSDGQRYLDCGGYGVFLLGHRHPAVVEAVQAALAHSPLSTRLLLNPSLAVSAADVSAIAPAGLSKVAFTNSGAEAVELALKVARSAGYRRIIATANGFHGKTLGALSVTGRHRYRAPFVPLLPGVRHVPYGDGEAVAVALREETAPAAVIVEPVQSEGGVIVPPDGYLRELRALSDRVGAALILDEVQTGLGRLGTLWGADHDGVRPDIMVLGKALGGGVMPVGAVLATPAIFEVLDREPLLHSSTFAGNPLAMAAVAATIKTMTREGIVARSSAIGASISDALATLACAHPGVVRSVRGRGLLIGVQFTDAHLAAEFVGEMLDRRVLVNYSLNADDVVRLSPPAIMSPSDLAALIAAVRASAAALQYVR